MDPAPCRPYEVTWEDWFLGGGPSTGFADPTRPLEVEIGPGEDDYLLDSALAHPDRNWLGIEYSHKRIARYARKVERRAKGLANLRLIWRPAADLVEPFLSPARVQAYHVHFPDPWPKKHHGRYRLFAPEFVRAMAGSLVPGGTVGIATDERAYVDEILAAFAAVPEFESELPPPGFSEATPGARLTVFEERWRSMGRAVFALRYRRAGA